jgi:hypothetical protein
VHWAPDVSLILSIVSGAQRICAAESKQPGLQFTDMARVQERAEKQKKLSAAEIVKALEEHIGIIVTPKKAGSAEDELAAELTSNQSQVVLKLGPEQKPEKNRNFRVKTC